MSGPKPGSATERAQKMAKQTSRKANNVESHTKLKRKDTRTWTEQAQSEDSLMWDQKTKGKESDQTKATYRRGNLTSYQKKGHAKLREIS